VKSQRVDSGQFKLYQAQDGVIYLDEINRLCANPNSPPLSPAHFSSTSVSSPTTTTTWNGSLFILVPLRLGLDQLNPVYVDVVKESFRFPQSIGIIGGKPHSAYYFIALQGINMIRLPSPFLSHSSASASSSSSSSIQQQMTTCII
jgi:cysteine protease ATG4